MSKRGRKAQLTIIIIIAVVIIALGLITFFLWPQISALFMNQEQTQRFLASQAEPLRQSVSDCVTQVSSDAFQKMGLQAGYYDTTGLNTLNYLDTTFIVVVYKDAAMNRINKLPSLPQVSQQYSLFLEKEGNKKIDDCLGNLASFKRTMNIEAGARKITPVFYDDSIMLLIDWPMKLSKGEVSQEINQKNAELLIPFGKMWKNANAVVDCETQIGCAYEGTTWDKDVWDNPLRIRYITREARSLNKDQIVFLFESIPQRAGEQPFKFNFGIDRL
jgi:hypothetical protein